METFYFGDPDHALFGAFHDAGAARNVAVLLIPAHGHEYVRSHRAMHIIAQRLASLGCDVLRVELTGQGDSAGEDTEGDVDRWRRDVKVAVGELRDRSMARSVSAVGLRLGAALLAAAVARDALDIDKLILWDPVIRGSEYLNELDRLHIEMLADPHRFDPPRKGSSESNEQLGFAITPQQRASIRSLDLTAQVEWPCRRVCLVAGPTVSNADIDAVGERIRAAGTKLRIVRLAGSGGWTELRKVEDTLQAPEAITTIADELTAGATAAAGSVAGR